MDRVLKAGAAILIGMPLLVAGMLCIASVWLLPLGIPLVLSSAIPLFVQQRRSIRKKYGLHKAGQKPTGGTK